MTVTEAARNFSDLVNRVYYRGESTILTRNGVPVAYLPFEGEQHGFRQAKNIKRSLDAELYFYSRVLGFELADEIEPLEIENL